MRVYEGHTFPSDATQAEMEAALAQLRGPRQAVPIRGPKPAPATGTVREGIAEATSPETPVESAAPPTPESLGKIDEEPAWNKELADRKSRNGINPGPCWSAMPGSTRYDRWLQAHAEPPKRPEMHVGNPDIVGPKPSLSTLRAERDRIEATLQPDWRSDFEIGRLQGLQLDPPRDPRPRWDAAKMGPLTPEALEQVETEPQWFRDWIDRQEPSAFSAFQRAPWAHLPPMTKYSAAVSAFRTS